MDVFLVQLSTNKKKTQRSKISKKTIRATLSNLQLMLIFFSDIIGGPYPFFVKQATRSISTVTLFIVVVRCRATSECTICPPIYSEMVGVGSPNATHKIVILPPSRRFDGSIVGA